MAEKTVNTTCGYCSTGCNLSIRDGVVTANPAYPVNLGKACPKGFQMLGHLNAPDRASVPLLRNAAGELQPVSWDVALGTFAERFKDIQRRHGKESIAFLNTGQITNEEFAHLGALGRFGMGIMHADGNTRQCMSTAAVAYHESFGFDAPPFTYKDFELSDVLIFIGSNPVIAHPIMWNRVRMNRNNPTIFVLDPRRTETARSPQATHYALRPKSDLVLLYGLANLLIEEGWTDQGYIDAHTRGFADFEKLVRPFTLERVTEATGLEQAQVRRLAEAIHQGRRVSFWWMVGINQGHQAVRTAQAIIDLALLTGNIGRPGTGANSITGQCNAMGSRLFGNTSGLLCGHDFENPEHRAKVAGVLGIDPRLIPDHHGLLYDGIVEAIDRGEIKGLWIVCTNPAHSWIDREKLLRALSKLEFLVVQDMFHSTETAQLAHLVLAAGGCGEKQGTLINSERRFGLVQPVSRPPGEALPNFEILRRVAQAWGCGEMFAEWTSPEAVFGILKRLSRGRPCDFSGIRDYAMIEEQGGIQWPLPEGAVPEKERRLFEDGRFYHADARACFIFEDVSDPIEKPDAAYPFVLLTGRGSVAQWHTLTRTGKAPLLVRMSPKEAYVEVCAEDAGRLGIGQDGLVVVASRRGRVTVKARVTDAVQPGQAFMPMHYVETNALTFPAFDPYSRQPSYKFAAVQISRAG